ncbi:ABC transporter permease [Bradyrhizobium guangxiense]
MTDWNEVGRRSAFACAGVGAFVGLWFAASAHLHSDVLLPQPNVVFTGFIDLLRDGSLIKDVAASFKRVMGGFAIASLLAVPLALLMAAVRPLDLLLSPVISFLRPIPPIAWIPIAILWFGIGDPPSYFITAIASFFPIFINAYAGGKSVQPQHVHAARSLGAGPRALFTRDLPAIGNAHDRDRIARGARAVVDGSGDRGADSSPFGARIHDPGQPTGA